MKLFDKNKDGQLGLSDLARILALQENFLLQFKMDACSRKSGRGTLSRSSPTRTWDFIQVDCSQDQETHHSPCRRPPALSELGSPVGPATPRAVRPNFSTLRAKSG
ncbi:PREDICTED: secretagogin [Myotis brandtii]|uniref:secretagogin n=1 Tax=Myotis brandtii TaxID=109478 RepID=UPI0007043966|nr:PREDICTED: secretagogin [Myotis brandtii]